MIRDATAVVWSDDRCRAAEAPDLGPPSAFGDTARAAVAELDVAIGPDGRQGLRPLRGAIETAE